MVCILLVVLRPALVGRREICLFNDAVGSMCVCVFVFRCVV